MDRVSSKLVTDFDGHKKLVTFNAIRGKVVIQTVQEEEEYMEHLGTIIQRDYFPDLASIRGGPVTPSNLDSAPPSARSANKSKVDTHNPEQVDPTSFSLDKYLANNTTEDDASFAELIEETEKKHRIGLSSFFPSIQAAASSPNSDESKPLGLPGGSHVHVGPRLSLTGSNAVHFNPDGVAHTQDEFLDHLANDRRIVPSNTRFKRPLPPAVDKRSLAKQLVLHKLGHIGLDGKESQSALSTPQAGGFKFLDASPSPAPSALGASPFMTWGELDATPSRLDDGALTPTVASGAPAFRIPSPSKREQLAHQLADKAGRQRVRDRNEAVRRVHSGVPSPATRSLLSPAARRLLASSSSILHSGGGSRPGTGSSHTCFANSPLTKSHTPRRLPSDLGVVRRPTSGFICYVITANRNSPRITVIVYYLDDTNLVDLHALIHFECVNMDRVSSKLVTDFDGHKKLVTFNAIRGKVVIQTVQEEEEYMEHLGTIIQRDYFPDLASIRGGPVTPSNLDSAPPSARSANKSKVDTHNPEHSPATRSLLSPAARRLLASSSSILHSGGGSRPGTGSSHTCFANSPLTKSHTPRRLPSDLGVVRRPTSGRSTSVCPSPASNSATGVTNYKIQNIKTKSDTMSLETTEMTQGLNESITDNLLNLRTPHH
ncbi:hypothetical protein AHF37_05619 [Paragonimus kellicotti]|nr:hypothetical protein AHF37_05619 [Paragonimus kellicotti]